MQSLTYFSPAKTNIVYQESTALHHLHLRGFSHEDKITEANSLMLLEPLMKVWKCFPKQFSQSTVCILICTVSPLKHDPEGRAHLKSLRRP